MNTQNFTKDPNAHLDYQIDWTPWLEGDEITSSQWFVPAPLTQPYTSYNTATAAVVWLAGGKVGKTYTVTNRITTSSNPARIQERSIYVTIKEL